MTKRSEPKPAAMPIDDPATAVLRRRAELLAQPLADAHDEPGTPVLTFSRGGRLAIDVERVREVSPLRKVEPLPEQPPFVAGLVAWRGRPVVAIDPAAVLGMAAEDHPTHQIVLGLSRGDVALLANDIRGVIAMRRDSLVPAPASPSGLERFAGGFHESVGLLLDADRIEASLLDLSDQSQEVRR